MSSTGDAVSARPPPRHERPPPARGPAPIGQPARRHLAQGDLDDLRASRGRRGRAGEGEDRALDHALALGDGIGPGDVPGPAIGLEGGIAPIALILHLPDIALHPHRRFETGHDLVAEGADIHEGLMGADRVGKARLLHGLIRAGEGERSPGDPGQRMQDAEAGPRGGEIRQRPGLGLEGEPARRGCLDNRLDLELTPRGLVEGAVADANSASGLLDLEIGDLRRWGFPTRPPDDEGDAAQGFNSLLSDIAELARFEVEAERSLGKAADRRRGLLGAVENDRRLGLYRRHRRLLCQSPELAALAAKVLYLPRAAHPGRGPAGLWRAGPLPPGRVTGVVTRPLVFMLALGFQKAQQASAVARAAIRRWPGHP